MRLGFGAKVLGQPGLKSHDTRRWQNGPHLSVSLVYLRDIFAYLQRHDIRMYRMSSELAPYVTHPDLPHFHRQIDECQAELALLGEMARTQRLRLSFHPRSHVTLSTPDPAAARRSTADLKALARLLDSMGLGPEAVIVLHVGGAYDDKEAAAQRFVERFLHLPAFVCRRLALEHDDALYSLVDVYAIHRRTGIPLVFDYLHFRNHNPEGMALTEALRLALSTWPVGVTPKVHFSSPRTEMRLVTQTDAASGQRHTVVRPPLTTQHADFANPFEFIAFLRAAQDLPDFDVLLELKAKDLALLRLRRDVARFAPGLCAHLDLTPAPAVREPEPEWSADHILGAEEPQRVLVVIVNNRRDWELVRREGWYRIPLARAPRQVAADYLAFYQTAVFGDEKWAVNYYAPVRRYRVVTRRELLPDEADHPRANERYFKVELGPVQPLPRPIPSRRLRRITFIPTTLERLLNAEEINDLWIGHTTEEHLWAAFQGQESDPPT